MAPSKHFQKIIPIQKLFLNVMRNILPLCYEHLCVITDFEMPLMNSVQNVMPDNKLIGCWFHYCQAEIESLKEMAKRTQVRGLKES
ncbi:MULE domain-containing protein, partial [Aphis craccivora]